MTDQQFAIVAQELQQQRVLLAGILAELQSWKPTAPVECPHPEEALQDLGSMGHPWVRCRACGTDVKGGRS